MTKAQKDKRQPWTVSKLGKRAERLGVVMAVDEREALDLAVQQFDIPERDRARLIARPGY